MRFGSSFNGEVGVFDLSGHYTALYKAPVGSVFRNVPLSWSANGKEVWFTSIEARYQGILYAANLQGKVRRVMELPGMATLEDVQRDGRVLVTLGTLRFDIAIQDHTGSHDLPWFGFSRIPRLAGDARSLIFGEEATQQFDRSIYRRSLDGGSAVKLSAGIPIAFSPSGRYIIAWRSDADPAYLIVPTGAGQERPLRLQGYELGPGAPIAWLPDEQNLVARAHEPGHTANRLVVYNIESALLNQSLRSYALLRCRSSRWFAMVLPYSRRQRKNGSASPSPADLPFR
jgi:dipeptidyl aminopeptidase/acylaminoacyl peptidase